MPTYFPQINAHGVMVQRPFMTTLGHLTSAQEQATGRRYGYAWRNDPLARWSLEYGSLTDAEVAVVEGFFTQMEGRLGEFSFLDPGGNLVQYSEDFSHASWEKYDVSVGAWEADPFVGNYARSVPGGSNGMLATYILPEGGAAGFVLCGSIWVKAPYATTLSIGFIDSGFNVLDNRIWNLPAGAWVRLFCATTLQTNNPIRLLLGGFGTWAGVSLSLFGAQAAPLPGPGGYQRTPGNYGLHAKCRFDTDRFEVRYVGPGQATLRLPIQEYK